MTNNQRHRNNLKAQGELENPLSSSSSEVEMRISALVATFPSRVEAAKVAGISTEQLKRYEIGAKPRLEPIARLCAAAGWSIDYVWRGKAIYAASPDRPRNNRGVEDAQEVRVPIYDVEASAGDGAFVTSERITGYYSFSRNFIRNNGWRADRLALIWGRGDSMPGVIEDGQLALINLAENVIRGEGTYVLLIDDRLVIKTVQPDHLGNLTITSTNPRYRDIHVPRDEAHHLRIVGRAVWPKHLI